MPSPPASPDQSQPRLDSLISRNSLATAGLLETRFGPSCCPIHPGISHVYLVRHYMVSAWSGSARGRNRTMLLQFPSHPVPSPYFIVFLAAPELEVELHNVLEPFLCVWGLVPRREPVEGQLWQHLP